jgi:hypothetical protein
LAYVKQPVFTLASQISSQTPTHVYVAFTYVNAERKLNHLAQVVTSVKHQSLVAYQGHGMVQQHRMRCKRWKQLPQFGLRLVVSFRSFDRIRPEKMLGSEMMVHHELVQQQNIPHWSHIKTMELFSSTR